MSVGVRGPMGVSMLEPDSALADTSSFVRAGELCDWNFDEALMAITGQVLATTDGAPRYDLQQACVLPSCLEQSFRDIVRGVSPAKHKTWKGMVNLRISETWRSRKRDLIWLDDKVLQVSMAASFCNDEAMHLPLLASAEDGDSDALENVQEVVRKYQVADQAFVVKPRHGANSLHVHMWISPCSVPESDVFQSINDALQAKDGTWDKECWQLSQVPRGVVVQPLYRTLVGVLDEQPQFLEQPLELSVLVLFGAVVGGVLNRHPFELWVTRDGTIHVWRPEDLKTRSVPWSQKHGKRLEQGVVETLRLALRSNWACIYNWSERLVRQAGLDELRVDWLLGDEQWGPRVGELTYMGAGSRFAFPGISEAVALAYAKAHLNYLNYLRGRSETDPA